MLPLSDLEPSIDVEKSVVPTRFVSKHAFNACINSLSPFNFLHSRFKSTVFSPKEEAQTFSRGKGGHCEYRDLWAQTHYSVGLGPGPPHEAAHYIKTTQEPTRLCSPRTRLGS